MKFPRYIILLLISLLILGCNRSQEKAFIDLKNAFVGWYLKSNPLISENFNQLENINGWRNYGIERVDEYFADLHRFFIELSQIDRSKLSSELEFEYLILWSFLKNTLYREDHLNPKQWNLNLWTNKLKSGLENLNLECGTLTAREEKILKSRLNKLDIFSEQILNHLTIPVKSYTENGYLEINKLQNRILTFLVECESDSNIYERWDTVLSSSHNLLTQLSAEIKNRTQADYPLIEKDIWENGYEEYFGQYLDELISVKEIDKEIEITIEQMLNISIPLYLKDYDEPIWVSKQDTLQVINTIFKSFNLLDIRNSEIVEQTYKIIDELKKQFKSTYFSNIKYPKFEFSVGDSNSFYKSEYKTGFSKTYHANFNIPQENDSAFVVNKTFLEYQIINEIFPGKLTLLSQNSKSNRLIKLLQNNQFITGWELYIQDLILNSTFVNDNPKVALLILENKLLSILKLKTQMGFMYSIDFKIDSSLLFSTNAKKSLNDFWHYPFPNLGFLLLNEILELKEIYLENKENDINGFNYFISHNGSHYVYVRQNLVDSKKY